MTQGRVYVEYIFELLCTMWMVTLFRLHTLILESLIHTKVIKKSSLVSKRSYS